MRVTPEQLAIGSTVALSLVLAWALLSLIGHLRRTQARYRWFELFTCVFILFFGFAVQLGLPRTLWSARWAWFASAAILIGGVNLGIVLLERFSRRAVSFPGSVPSPTREPVACAFCGASQAATSLLIQGPSACICSSCVSICTRLVTERGL